MREVVLKPTLEAAFVFGSLFSALLVSRLQQIYPFCATEARAQRGRHANNISLCCIKNRVTTGVTEFSQQHR